MMAKIFWRPAGSESRYGSHDVTPEYMDEMDSLMVERIESRGHTVDVGSRTDSDCDERKCDDDTVDLDAVFGDAWDWACHNYDDVYGNVQ